jgi:8-oxo-dGTP pyrophosphatase MutT (NUDIX family)
MAKSKFRDSIQFAALPWRIGADESRQIMLLTSRETRRWVIPKGWPMKGLKPPEAAAREAFEEAGLVGRIIGKQPIGLFHYNKRLLKDDLLCEVWVFLLWVERQLDDWPEKGQRETNWFSPAEAASLVDEGGLAEVIRHAFVSRAIAPGSRRLARRASSARHSSSRSLLGSKSP